MRVLTVVLMAGMCVVTARAQAFDGLLFSNGDDAPYCREYSRNVMVGGRMQEGYGTACLQPDGSWKIQQEQVGGVAVNPVTQYEYIPATSVVRTVTPSRVIVQRPVVYVDSHRPYYRHQGHYYKRHGHHYKHHGHRNRHDRRGSGWSISYRD